MIAQGSKMHRFDGTPGSAWKIVHCVLDTLEKSEARQIQHELVNIQQDIPEADGGKTLRYSLQQLLEKQAEELEAQDAQVQAKLEEHQNQMRTTLKQINDLKIPISRRVMGFFGLRVSFLVARM
jgi:predicted  nucleic acid-binding Zn-ribbon protein